MPDPAPRSPGPSVVVLLQRDLRLADNPALAAAAATGLPVVPTFIWSPKEEHPEPGGASRWWLHRSLASLSVGLRLAGSPLVLRRGPLAEAVTDLCREAGAVAVHLSAPADPFGVANVRALTSVLLGLRVEVRTHPGLLLHEPDTLLTQSGTPYRVFSPFWRALQAAVAPGAPLPAPEDLRAPATAPRSLALEELGILPAHAWHAKLDRWWTPGEQGAWQLLGRLASGLLTCYSAQRDLPAMDGTSRLSPHLRFGEVSPRQVWAAAREAAAGTDEALPFLRQLAWREFAHHLLWHFPRMLESPLNPAFEAYPWGDDQAALQAWKEGRTGYPIVDAGLRQLWETGWMHNRVRMLVGSFLVKDLLLPWQEGARWFWDTLVDACPASNSLGWQWVAGCGADAAPFFRIFNPIVQGERFDPRGEYVRRWIPELRGLPDSLVHRPWDAERPPKEYPAPIIDHAFARERALAALRVRSSSA